MTDKPKKPKEHYEQKVWRKEKEKKEGIERRARQVTRNDAQRRKDLNNGAKSLLKRILGG